MNAIVVEVETKKKHNFVGKGLTHVINFMLLSKVAGTSGNAHFNPSYQSPTVWPPFAGSSWTTSSSANGFGARPSPTGFAPSYPGGFQSYPAWRPTAAISAPAYNYYWPKYYRESPDQEYDYINDVPEHSFQH